MLVLAVYKLTVLISKRHTKHGTFIRKRKKTKSWQANLSFTNKKKCLMEIKFCSWEYYYVGLCRRQFLNRYFPLKIDQPIWFFWRSWWSIEIRVWIEIDFKPSIDTKSTIPSLLFNHLLCMTKLTPDVTLFALYISNNKHWIQIFSLLMKFWLNIMAD